MLVNQDLHICTKYQEGYFMIKTHALLMMKQLFIIPLSVNIFIVEGFMFQSQ